MAGPHQGQPVLSAGESLERARAAMILVHGRGASAADIMTVAGEVMYPGVAYLAPQAAGNAWYPYPFTAPLESNEPYLSSALEVLSVLLARVQGSVLYEKVVLLGFSQGACLTLRFAARKKLERHGEMLELFALGILHDRLRLHVPLERDALLVPADRLCFLLQ